MPERNRFAAGLGLATLLPLVLAPALGHGAGAGTPALFGALVVVAYAGHVAATGWLWTVPDVRRTVAGRPLRLVALPAVLVLVASAAAVLLSRSLLQWLLLGYFAWQFRHFQRQNLGLVRLIGARWHAEPLARRQRGLVSLAGWCGGAALLAKPSLLGLSSVVVPPYVARVVGGAAAVGFATCVVIAVCTVSSWRRPGPVTAAFIASVVFMAPVFVCRSPVAAVSGMVISHGLQHLWVVTWRSHEARHPDGAGVWRTAAAVAVVAVVGGVVLEAMSELQPAGAFGLRLAYGAYLGIVMAHFSVESVIWRRPVRPQAAASDAQVKPPIGRWPLLPSPAHGRL